MKDARNAKLRNPISNEKQLLDFEKQDLSLKRKMMEAMKEVNKEYTSDCPLYVWFSNSTTTIFTANTLPVLQQSKYPLKCAVTWRNVQ